MDIVKRDGMHVLVFNAGSSSLKCGLYKTTTSSAQPLLEAQADGIGKPGVLRLTGPGGAELARENTDFADLPAAATRVAAAIEVRAGIRPEAIGHRVVHGGTRHLNHFRINDQALDDLRAAAGFAPLHVPPALAIIDLTRGLYPDVPQVACLDTAFHATLPEEASVLPLPRQVRDQGVRRYGFHGLSCESVMARLLPPPGRVVIAHLGSGASLTAVRNGKSADTSMGLTPDGGIMMGSRSGDLDPGVMLWLMRTYPDAAGEIDAIVTRHAGLAGVSGMDGDLKTLHQAADAGNGDATLALRMFVLAVAKQVAAYAAVLGGLDLLIFTGGIGEHDSAVRAQVCARLTWMGAKLDEARNAASADVINAPDSSLSIRVMESAEGEVIARHAFFLVQ